MAGRIVITEFASGQRIRMPATITRSVIEYFVPHPLADVVVHAVDAIPAVAKSAVLAAPWLLNAARFEVGSFSTRNAGNETARSLALLSQGRITAEKLRATHAVLVNRPRSSSWRDAIAWVDGRSLTDATLVPPPSSAIDALTNDLCTFLARSDVPMWGRQAIAYYQFLHIHPFANGNGRMSRVLVAALGAASLPAMLVALALCVHRRTTTLHFAAMRAGSTSEYLDRWHRLDEWAHKHACEIAAREDVMRTELAELVGANNAQRLFVLFAHGGWLTLREIAMTLRWSAKNASRHLARLRDAGWAVGPDDALQAYRVRVAQRELVAEVERHSAAILV